MGMVKKALCKKVKGVSVKGTIDSPLFSVLSKVIPSKNVMGFDD